MDYVLIFGHSSIANLKHVRVCRQQIHFQADIIFLDCHKLGRLYIVYIGRV